MGQKVLICTVGLPRSGKTTWARQFSKDHGVPIVNPDSIRRAIHKEVFLAEREMEVWDFAHKMTESLFLAGHDSVILDATNTTRERRQRWQDPRWNTIFHFFPRPKEECIAQALADERPDLVPVIERMAAAFESFGTDEVTALPLGATGEFPSGEYSAGDEGELRIAIAADRAARLVRIEFGKQVSWLAFPPENAITLADCLRQNARKCKGG